MLGRMLNLNDNTFQENWRWNSHLRWPICFLGLKPFRLLGEFSPLFLGNHLIEENHIIELLNMEILLQTWISILLEERMLRKMKYLVNYWTSICWMWLQIGLIHEFNNIHFTWGDWKFFLLQCCSCAFFKFFVVETILLQCLITCAEIRSRFPLELNSKTFTSFIMPNFVEFSVLFRIVCSFILFITSCVILRKQEAAILKSSVPAIFTLHKLIIVRYDAILDHSERVAEQLY